MPDNKEKYVCQLSPELQARAKAELNEEPARREKDIEMLRDWLKKQPHINARTDDAFLLRFLRNAKFSIERAKEKIDNFYTMRTAIPEWFTNLDVSYKGMQYLLSYGIFLPLGYDKDGRRVALIRSGSYDPSKVKWDDIMRLSGVLNEHLIRDEQSQINGIVMINDMSGMTGAHVAQFTPMIMKKSMALWTNCQPLRIKAMHYWKPPTFFEKIFFVSQTFYERKAAAACGSSWFGSEILMQQFPSRNFTKRIWRHSRRYQVYRRKIKKGG
ncbi:hypothetical protein CHUAL_009876 [Chamberlinius hualienensis]